MTLPAPQEVPADTATLPTCPGPGESHRAPPLRTGAILPLHILFTLLYSVLFANTVWLMPLLVRLRFGAADPHWKDWQTTLVTAAVPTFMMLSIFWHELLGRMSLRTYLLIFWLLAVFPLGCVGFVHNYWQFLACHVIATIGLAGWQPVNGKLLAHFYPHAIRGRIYAVLNVVTLAAAIASVYVVGAWLEDDPDGFRVYFPAAALLQVIGIAVLVWLARRTAAPEESARAETPSWSTLLRPILHMGAVLRADRTFFRYERAFMTYGAAYMLCDALLPVLATAQLGMRYEEYANATQVVLRIAMLAAMPLMGWLVDRLGPVRTSGLSFAVLAFYPALLLLAGSPRSVGVASGVYGIGLAGVQICWMIGPVLLAGTSEKVPQYVAIHTTLVGVRGILFQSLGMLLYQLTGTFTVPLIAASLAFLWATLQMRRLHEATRSGATAPIPTTSTP